MDTLLNKSDTDEAALMEAHLAYQAKLNELTVIQDMILELIVERKQLGLPYSSEFWKHATCEENDFKRIDLMLEQSRIGLAMCLEIHARQKEAAGK